MKRTLWLHTICSVAIVLLVGLIFASPAVSADPVEVSADQVKAMIDGDKATVIFPLSLIEFNNLHIQGSVNVPIAEIPADLPADKTRALVFYCLGFT